MGVCRKCGSDNRSPGGDCRPCRASYMRAYYADPERKAKKVADDLNYRLRLGDLYAEKLRKRRAGNVEKARASQRARYAANKEKIQSQTAASVARRRAKDPEAWKAKVAAAERRRREENPTKRINGRVSTRVRQSLKGSKYRRQWESLLGYTLSELIDHLMTTMPSGYTWQDFVDAKLEIDHIRPISSFRFESAECAEFRECWSLSNLQLLPAAENNRKKDRLDWLPGGGCVSQAAFA